MSALVFILIKRVSVALCSDSLLNTDIWIIWTLWHVPLVSVINRISLNVLLGKDYPTFYDLLLTVKANPQDGMVATRGQLKREKAQQANEERMQKSCRVKLSELEDKAVDITSKFSHLGPKFFADAPPNARAYKDRNQKCEESKEHQKEKNKTTNGQNLFLT